MNKKQIAKNLSEDEMNAIIQKLASITHKSLSSPADLDRVFPDYFSIDENTTKQLIDLINQRLRNDEEKILDIDFSVTIHFDDNSKETLPYEKFKLFNDTEGRIPTDLILRWAVLMDFKDSTIPEKQTLIVHFSIPGFDTKRRVLSFRGKLMEANSAIFVLIEHTNRIWALDLLHHIEKQINQITSKYKTIGNKATRIVTKLAISLNKTLLDTIPYFSGITYLFRKYQSINFNNSSLSQIHEEILTVSLVIILTTGIGLFWRRGTYLARPLFDHIQNVFSPQSYILFTDKAREFHQNKNQQRFYAFLKTAGGIIAGLLVNIISAYIVLYLFKWR